MSAWCLLHLSAPLPLFHSSLCLSPSTPYFYFFNLPLSEWGEAQPESWWPCGLWQPSRSACQQVSHAGLLLQHPVCWWVAVGCLQATVGHDSSINPPRHSAILMQERQASASPRWWTRFSTPCLRMRRPATTRMASTCGRGPTTCRRATSTSSLPLWTPWDLETRLTKRTGSRVSTVGWMGVVGIWRVRWMGVIEKVRQHIP